MKPYGHVKVYRWYSSEKSELYVFDGDSTYSGEGKIVKDTIYKDFTIEDAVARIGLYIENTPKFYAWTAGRSILFEPSGPWKGYNVNPFKSYDHSSSELKEPVQYDYKTKDLFCYTTINIAFEKDLPKSLKGNSYYFTKLKTQTYNQYRKLDEKLSELKMLQAENVKLLPEVYVRISMLTKMSTSLAEVFDSLSATKHFEMVQWINDTSKVLYKVWKGHKISKEYLMSWTNMEKIARMNAINIYSSIDKNRYCKITIDGDSNVSMNYILDSRKYTKWSDVQKHKEILIKGLESVIRRPVKLKEISLNLHVSIEITNPSIKLLINNLGKYIDVFHTIKINFEKNKQSVVCTYKRSSNYKKSTDIYDYIKSRIAIGISRAGIIEELNNLGIQGDLEKMVDDEMDSGSIPIGNESVKVQDNGTILVIQPYHQGFIVNVTNCPNHRELQYMLYWLTKIVSLSFDKKQKKVPVKPASPVVQPSPSPSPKRSSSSASSSVSQGSIDFSSLGGAKNNYMINILQQADKDLFTENYARDKCQNASQPVVFTEDEKKELERTNQMHFDNYVKYGSRKDMQNYYACPRLWCPQSKVPLDVADPNAKCPIENEEPMEMFWSKDKNKKRFVKLTKQNDKGMCVPCCMKLPPKTEDTKRCMAFIEDGPAEEERPADNNDENYIMNKSSPIPLGRFGSVPEYLHHLLQGDRVKYESCTKTLNKSHRCFVRKGMKPTKSDNLLQAVVDLLGFSDKAKFMKEVRKRLDVLTFITLDNGRICRDFLNTREMNPSDHTGALNELNAFRKNSTIFNISSMDTSRLLNVFYAYKRYIEYLSADALERSSSHLYSLVQSLFDRNVLIFERLPKTNELHFECSRYYKSYHNKSFGIILKEERYYEPVVFKMRSTEAISFMKLDDYPSLKKLLNNCPSSNVEFDVFQNVFSFNSYIKTGGFVKRYKDYVIGTVFINNDFTINKFLTKGNVVLQSNTIGISFLKTIIESFEIPHSNVVFYEDVVGTSIDARYNTDDLEQVSQKCKSLGIKMVVGRERGRSEETNELLTTHTFEKDIPNKYFMVHSYEPNGFYDSIGRSKRVSKRWYELKRLVAKTVLKAYDDERLRGLAGMERADAIALLVDLFKGVPQKKKIGIILEEMPLDSVQAIKRWVADVVTYTKYNFLSSVIKDGKNEFVFSQNALVKNGIHRMPAQLLKYSRSMPSYINSVEEEVQNVDVTTGAEATSPSASLPEMFNGTRHSLPSKWSSGAKSDWNRMEYVKCTYQQSTLTEFLAWFAKKIKKSIQEEDVHQLIKEKYISYMNNRSGMIELFQDQSFLNKWIKIFVKTANNTLPRYTPQDFYDKKYSLLSNAKKIEHMQAVLGDRDIFPNDLDIVSVAELMNVSVLLVLNRAKYTTNDKDKKRGTVQDFVMTSSFFQAPSSFRTSPFLIIHKVSDKATPNFRYYLIFEKSRPNDFYFNFEELPKDIKLLVEGHLAV